MASGDRIFTFNAWDYDPANSNPAVPDLIADSTADLKVIAFDKTANRKAVYEFVVPPNFTSSADISLTIHGYMASATSGDVDIDIQLKNLNGVTVGSLTYDTVTSIDNTAVPSPALTEFSITGTIANANLDGIQAGHSALISILRDQASDTASGDFLLKDFFGNEV